IKKIILAWLLQHGNQEKAFAAVEAGQGPTEILDENNEDLSRTMDDPMLQLEITTF
ncbi:hypothetical protein MKX01_042626, partial [Papaver californicum]